MRRLVVASSALLLSSLFVGCAGVTPTGGRLPAQQVPKAEVIEQHAAVSTPMVSTAELQAAYVAAGSPTIGFIRDSYLLPVANPLGAARIIEGNAFGMPYQQSLTVPSTYRPFAIQPMDNGFAVQQLALLQQDLATAGVRFVEVSTADANRIVDAEKKAAEANGKVQFNEMTRAGSDILVSYQPSQALGGPIFIVRVIRMADGALLALRTGPGQGGAIALRPLLGRAIADGLQAAANHPLR
jgi:hypothetical protein